MKEPYSLEDADCALVLCTADQSRFFFGACQAGSINLVLGEERLKLVLKVGSVLLAIFLTHLIDLNNYYLFL